MVNERGDERGTYGSAKTLVLVAVLSAVGAPSVDTYLTYLPEEDPCIQIGLQGGLELYSPFREFAR